MTADSDLTGQRVLVTGAGGQLGSCLIPALRAVSATPIGLGAHAAAGVDVVADLTDGAAAQSAVTTIRPDAVIHAAAWTDVDGCELDPVRADAVNHLAAAVLATACHRAGVHLLGVGTDFVFSGKGGAPYREGDRPDPVSVYGATKLEGEQAILAADPAFAVARTAWVFGGSGKHFPRTVLQVLRRQREMGVVADEFGNPTYAPDLADALVALLSLRGSGVFHLTNEGAASRYGFAQRVVSAAGLDPGLITPSTRAEFLASFPLPAARPADSRLANIRAASMGIRLRDWSAAVDDYVPGLADDLWPERLLDLEVVSRCVSS